VNQIEKMNKLIFATNNHHKVEEIRSVIGKEIEVVSLKEAGLFIEIPEPHDTLEQNASAKSRTIHELSGMDCFSEDTGLETDSLHGEPGVKSARYAGEDKAFDKNIDKLLSRLATTNNRNARFRTVISLILNKNEYFFEGICEGKIAKERKGNNGFGYDAVFVPAGSSKSFAEMKMEEKNKFSHRRKAVEKLILFLQHQKEQ
jgi:XTP/dITP diphosphohydrolase